MASSTRSPTTYTAWISGWQPGTAAYASDDTRMYNTTSDCLNAYKTFGFSLPSGSTIDGILVEVEGYGSTNQPTSRRAVQVGLTKDGQNLAGTAQVITLPYLEASEAYVSAGGATSLWGTTWSESEVESSNFGVRIDPNGTTYYKYIDHIRVTVYYTEPSGIDLATDEGAQSNAGDGTGISQAQIIGPAEGVQEQSGDAAGISQLQALGSAEGSQEQTGDMAEIGVSAEVGLEPAGGAQIQFGGGAAVTQTHVMDAAEGVQDQAGDEAVIILGAVSLETEKGSQEQAGDQAAADQAQNLAGSEGIHEQAGDPAGISQTQALLAAEGLQDQAGDPATVTVGGILLNADPGTQEQAGEIAGMAQAQTLAGGEEAQDQIGAEANLDLLVNLAIQEGSQSQGGDEPWLVQLHNLLTEEAAQEQEGGVAAVTTGELLFHEIIQRILLRSRIQAVRTGRNTDAGGFVEAVRVHDRIAESRLRRVE